MPIMLDKQRHMLFSLNVMVEVQDRLGDMEKLPEAFEGPGGLKEVRWLLTMLLNEGAPEGEPELTEAQVGNMIHMGNMSELKTAMLKSSSFAMNGSADPPEREPDDEYDNGGDEEGKNEQAGEVK